MLRVRVLGLLAVERDGRPVEIPRGRPLELISYLAIHPGPQPRGPVAERLWPDCAPERARQRLRTALWEVHRALSDRNDVLVDATRGVLCLHAGAGVDLLEARQLLDAGATEAALALLVPGIAEELHQAWAEQARFDAVAWRLEALHAATRDASDAGSALAHARRRVALDPLSEDAHRGLIRLLADIGDRSAAMQAYERMRLLLESELGVGPSAASRRLLARLSSEDPSDAFKAQESRSRMRRRVPVATTPLLGRAADLVDLEAAVRAGRLVSVVGPGGVGKSRIAFSLAAQEEDRGRAVAVAELATVGSADQCDYVVAASLRVNTGPGRAIRDAIIDRLLLEPGLLLVFDNCEHVLAAVRELVSHLLRWSAATTVLATSRESLALPGERVLRLAPLPVPADGEDEQVILACAAVQLLSSAARRSHVQAALKAQPVAELARLARSLDGLPLALELAGARIPSLGVTVLADRLTAGLDVLAAGSTELTGRHDSMLATLEWSITMLTPHERTLLGLLSVPPGPFPMSAVEAMVHAVGLTTDPVVGLTRLVEASLIQVHQDEVWCYSVLETVRVFGARLLGEQAAALVRGGLVVWAVWFVEGLRARELTDEQRAHVEALRFLPLMRAALQEARDRGDVQSQRWIITGLEGWATWREQPEVWAWVIDLAAEEPQENPDADILRMGAVATWRLGRIQEMITFTQRCVAADPQGASGPVAAAALMLLAFAERRWAEVPELAGPVYALGGADRVVAMTTVAAALARVGKPGEALDAARAAREDAERLGAPSLRALALLAEARAASGIAPKPPATRPKTLLAEARRLADSVGSAELVASIDKEQGLQDLRDGLPRAAVEPLRAACMYWLGTGNTGPLGKAINGLAESLVRTERPAVAERLLGLSQNGELSAPLVASLVPLEDTPVRQ